MSKAAYEINGDPATREAFYAIACDPRRSVAVEACAGAGKTWMLVSRIVRALLDGAEPHEILAITFTKKAAGEMRQRLQEWLADFARETEPQKLVQALVSRGIGQSPASNGHEALQNLYQSVLAADRPVQIRTFHSWFAALLRTAPLAVLQQLGLPGHYELLESDDEAVAALWRPFQATVAADAVLRADYAAVAAEHGRAQTQKALAAALSRRTEFVLADEAGVVEASVPPFADVFPEFAGLDEPSQSLMAQPVGRALLRTPVFGESAYYALVSRAAIARELTQHTYYDPLLVSPGMVRTRYQLAHQPGARFAASAYLTGRLDLPMRMAFSLLDKPILLLWGRDAYYTPVTDAADLRYRQPGARLEILDECGMLPHDECVGDVLRLTVDFLTRPEEDVRRAA